MAITKLSNSGIATGGVLKYDSMLAGNAAYIPSSFESIATAQPSGTGTLTFSSIPSTYTHLQIRGIYSGSVAQRSLIMRFNGDSASNYSWHELYGEGTGVASSGSASASQTYVGYASNSTADTFVAPCIIDIFDYANTNKYKTIKSLNGNDNNSQGFSQVYSGNWRSSSAITSITLLLNSGNFNNFSRFALYGIKVA